MSSHALACALLLSLACAGCRRTPEELPPPTTVASSQSAPAATLRAEAALSAQAPPVVSPGRKVPGCPDDPEGPPMLATLPVTFAEAAGAKVEAEIARTDHDVTRGLMYRTEMGADRGMLFRLPNREEQIFWMRNTCISLDMLFIDDDGTVVGILERVPILNEAPRTVRKPSRYVLEVNAGWAAAHGVRAGMKAKLPPL